ncbi:MAG: endonuclease MutS2 [Eubacteriales bacterium]|nr:endonuclease MutS2 [Eubacteriales bacterium]
MNRKTLEKLEYNKINDMLKSVASSKAGEELAEALEPSTDFNEIMAWQKETDDALSLMIKKGSPPLGGIRDIRSSLKRAELSAILNPGELLKIADVLRASRTIKSYGRDDNAVFMDNVIIELIGSLFVDRKLEDRISASIISEEEIADNASPTLNNIRRKIKNLQNSIKDKLESLIKSQTIKKYIQESIVTIREDRYVIPVKSEYRNEIPGLVHDSSGSGATLFIEPIAVVQTNNEIKELRIKEKTEIEKILSELTSAVVEDIAGLKTDMELLARIDFTFAKAKLSINMKCSKPVLNSEGRIVIKKGRHPLLDKNKVVPIDFWIGTDFKSLIVTGPNTGGKTVSLKTVGLLTVMAQAGLQVPANDGTEIAVFQKVFADIGDEQSIEQSLSTFSSHMTNLVKILREADDQSLVLLDELGAGTDPTEGAALAMAIIENLLARGATSVATTHYSELKLFALSTPGVKNASCEFDVNTLSPRYSLLIGVPGKSNAFAISSRLGLDKYILDRASEFLTGEDIRFEDVLNSMEQNRRMSEDARLEAERLKKEAAELSKEIKEKNKKLEAQRDKILRNAREEAARILDETKEEADGIIKDLIKLKDTHDIEIGKEAEIARQRLKRKSEMIEEGLAHRILPEQKSRPAPEDLKPGETVMIVDLNTEGTVLSNEDAGGNVLIQAGILKINVHASNLERIEEKSNKAESGKTSMLAREKVSTITTEIDVRGKAVDEAIEAVEKFIDDASLAGLGEVIIIHGKGTGALRSGIHKSLKSNSGVKTYRIGEYGEGDTGVTIVTLT